MGIGKFPSRSESIVTVVCVGLFIALTAIFIGLRPEHVFMALLFIILFYASPYTRKLAVAMLPFVIFGVSYDWMRICPNYTVNPIDVKGLHDLELTLFGMHDGTRMVIPGQYFYHHHVAVADFLAVLLS